MQAFSPMNDIDKHTNSLIGIKGFTLVELLVSIMISVLLLGGVFYFMSETIVGIARASAHAKFLKDFYGFTTILDTGNLDILHDYSFTGGYDVVLLTSLDGDSGIIIGVVDASTLKLASTGTFLNYQENILGYRSLSASEISQVQITPNLVYNYSFFPDKVFSNFYMKDFQIESFNSGALTEMTLTVFPQFKENLQWEVWKELPQDEVFQYSLVF